MKDPKNATEVINSARKNFIEDYIALGLKRQPDTKLRDEEQRLRMIVFESDIIRSKIDKSRFKPAPKEVVEAYGKDNA
jgi:hypothetical protein